MKPIGQGLFHTHYLIDITILHKNLFVKMDSFVICCRLKIIQPNMIKWNVFQK